ncbi:hypothetical protein G1H11_16230 [Phytoactinopolyspora alkaliphila]|uniref:Type II secretion system protein GspF domain-containing protein n=1 Tax=Phytoactinopolyspora alkaliphila TaxID=1783498 RepID=A0A6N9YPJ4_9ACTN|nr:type II secretion system F family protein [Phytoactinopolyspora alkaliphila]NED96855.1 hypothetical protein [Phytoactinopolyspora alkaliphila]
MTTQLTILAGMIAGLGALLVIREFVPRHPHPIEAARRLTTITRTVPTTTDDGGGLSVGLGRLILRRGGSWSILRIPHRDLALLGMSVSRFLGERGLLALAGLASPTASAVGASLAGWTPPIAVPVAVSLLAATTLSFLPYYTVAQQASRARAEFARAMTCYVDLVALERAGGAGPVQSLEHAATVGDSWVFARLRDELARARYRGTPAWDALRNVGEELRLPQLVKTGDVMRLAGLEGATVYDNLRARAMDMRNELLTHDKAESGVRTERATAPVAVTSIVFLLILATPMALAIG